MFGDKYVPSTERHVLNNEIKSNDYIRNHLLKYVNDGKADEAEIGQRIITAMEKVRLNFIENLFICNNNVSCTFLSKHTNLLTK